MAIISSVWKLARLCTSFAYKVTPLVNTESKKTPPSWWNLRAVAHSFRIFSQNKIVSNNMHTRWHLPAILKCTQGQSLPSFPSQPTIRLYVMPNSQPDTSQCSVQCFIWFYVVAIRTRMHLQLGASLPANYCACRVMMLVGHMTRISQLRSPIRYGNSDRCWHLVKYGPAGLRAWQWVKCGAKMRVQQCAGHG